MMALTPHVRVLVCIAPADFRKGIDGLARVCRETLSGDPFSGTMFVFRNRRGTAIKVLAYDGQGFWLCQNHLCSNYTSFVSRSGPWCEPRDARSLTRSQRLLCLLGWIAGSS
jgi:transposase